MAAITYHLKLPSVGVTLEVEYDYEPPQRASWRDPEIPESIEITSAFLFTNRGEKIDLLILADELGADEAINAFLMKQAEADANERFSSPDIPPEYDLYPWESPCE